MLGLLKRNCSSKHLSVRARRLLYLALVRTHLDYASEAWSGQSLNITSAIERVQRRATKLYTWHSKSLCSIQRAFIMDKSLTSRILAWDQRLTIHTWMSEWANRTSTLSDLWNLLPKRTIAAGAITTSLYQDPVQNIFNKVFLLDPVDCGILCLKNLN